MRTLRYSAISLLVLSLILSAFNAGAQSEHSGITAKIISGKHTTEISHAQLVFEYHVYSEGRGENVESILPYLPVIVNKVEKQQIPLTMIQGIALLEKGEREHPKAAHWIHKFIDVAIKLNSEEIIRGEIGTYFVLPSGEKMFSRNIDDILIVGTSETTGLETRISLFGVDRIFFKHDK